MLMKLIDWLDKQIIYWSKVLVTVLWLSMILIAPIVLLVALQAKMIGQELDSQTVLYALVCTINLCGGSPLIFRMWFGYWAFFTKRAIRKELRSSKFFTPDQRAAD